VSGDTGDDVLDLRSAPPPADEDEAAGPLAALVGGPGLRAALEAVLLVVDEPVAEVTLAQVLERPRGEVVETLHELAREYEDQGRGFELRQVAGGWRFYTRADCAAVVERFVLDGQQARLTQAALETLAVVAYRQPVSRGRIAGIRGVNVDGVVRTLLNRGLIAEAGTEADTHALLYRTTPLFLERLGLSGVEELPSLAPFLPELESLDDPDVSMSTLELEDMSHE
jgi:segregation and condensation protein B